jgi:alpha-L-fucosidase
MNRERLSRAEMRAVAEGFTAAEFSADSLCDLAVAGGMRYVCLTTMHHDGFRLYDSELSDFNSMRTCGRDLVAEIVQAARERNLRVSLYHSLNNWFDQPDAVAALESREAYEAFIENTFARVRELVVRFNPVDVLWYDGWWPFNAERWRAAEMNAMVRGIQPHILFNGRNGLPGDFGTPEGHMAAPSPWRPWEACMTLNDHWGYHLGDDNWKTPQDIVKLLACAAQGCGNLRLNVGPTGSGTVPPPSRHVIAEVGKWLEAYGECIRGSDVFTTGLMERNGHCGDWSHNGPFTRKGNSLYQIVTSWPGSELAVAGWNTKVQTVTLLGREGATRCNFRQQDGKVTVTGLPDSPPDPLCPVLRFDCTQPPELYLAGGMRIPQAPHPPYAPCPSDIARQPG